MNERGNGSLVPLIIFGGAIIVILFLVVFTAGPLNIMGDQYIKTTYQKQLPLAICDAKHFENDYGFTSKLEQFSYNSRTYFRTDFNKDFPTIVERGSGGDCYFVEDEKSLTELFSAYYYTEKIQSTTKNLYSPLITCNRKYKGAEELCKFSSTVKSVFESDAIELIAEIPEEFFEATKKRFQSAEWTLISEIGSTSVKFAKKFQKGTQIYVTIELIQVSSCFMQQPELTRVFDLANDVNQLYTDTHNKFYYKGTNEAIKATNLEIEAWYLIHEENKDFFKELIGYWANNAVNEGHCNEINPVEMLKSYNNSMASFDIMVLSDVKNFSENTTPLKEDANHFLYLEEQARINHSPEGLDLLKILKSMEYSSLSSGSKRAFEKQEYSTARELATQGIQAYAEFWEKTTWVDLIIGGAILLFGLIVILIVLGVIILNKFS